MKKYNLLNDVLGWVCFVIAAVTYLLTIEPTASFWDCPEFISQGAKLEVGHPPGNPIFMLAARFFVTIFGNNIANAAVAVNSMSALLSAATILLLFWSVTHLSRRLIVADDATTVSVWQMVVIFGAGICGALAYAWSDTFWFSAVEGEVYAFSSFCTALVFWLILKWENHEAEPHSDRYLILIAYIIGVSIAVHLLNLLCIPAIVLVFYYKKYKNITATGSLIALGVSFVIVALILYGLVPGFVKVAQAFELLFVNQLGASYNVGVLVYALLFVASFIWAVVALYRQKSAAMIKFSAFLTIVLSGMPFIGSWWVALILVAALGIYLFMILRSVPVRVFNVVILSIGLIFVGYSSYALLLIRSHANTPMNQNAPDNVFALSSYLNREQYGDRPLFSGAVFAEELETQEYPQGSGIYYVIVDDLGYPRTKLLDGVLRDERDEPYSTPESQYSKVVKTDPRQPDRYVEGAPKPNYQDIPDLKMLLPRVYSNDPSHVAGYKGWGLYETPDISQIPAEVRARWAEAGFAPLHEVAPYLSSQQEIVTNIDHNGNDVLSTSAWKPSFAVNLRYFFNYQFVHMYWRYFMWNFAGRQNDLQGNGEPHLGNWISGIPLIDNARLGDQSLLPDEYGKGNKGHNVFYMLPLLLGIIGLLWQAMYVKPGNPQRGIEQFWVVFFLFFMTGAAIVLYLNQTPGQPRERDYAFAGSFYAFAIWIGIGVPAIAMMLRRLIAGRKNKESRVAGTVSAAVAVAVGIAVPLQMVSQTWDDHDRSGRYAARDFGFNYLSSVGPNGIIFCNGDNDTFPLWYAQEVEGYRTDVRVVNLSYLTTDWYANQQRIPSYDAAPIPMYASPSDYAYNDMAWSFIMAQTDTLTPAKDALREMYSNVGRYKYHILTQPNIIMDVDSAAAMSAFGIDPENPGHARYIMPYLSDITTNISRIGKRGLNLGNVLSLDMIANSVENGFSRPVYFASTVPSDYYLGLTPFMSSTGMAMQVTPFAAPNAAPTVETAYDNIMSQFRWGGLDTDNPDALYLDETVRRMVSSTRSAIFSSARDLINTGDAPASARAIEIATEKGLPVPATHADMGRQLLELIETKLPNSVAPYDGVLPLYMAEAYYDLYLTDRNPADLEAARRIIAEHTPRYAQLVRYAQSLRPSQISALGNSELNALQYLGAMIAMQNRIETLAALEKNPEANAEIIEEWSVRPSYDALMRSTPLLYIQGFTEEDLTPQLANYSGSTRQVFEYALSTLKAQRAAGLDPMAISNAWMQEYDIQPFAWNTLLRY
ncbi:MAG: DUF2723 domain-containing protein [Muribaculaceae bacterium]|nr:DUF2723 domain-containing protein [Muribaculaceae bacterium]